VCLDCSVKLVGTVWGVRTRQLTPIVAAVLWTGFVWIGRIRNALADDELQGAALWGVLALSASFLGLALAAAVLTWLDRDRGAGKWLRRLVFANFAWASAVWAVRIVDIAFASDHDAPFIIVHVALGVVSAGLWMWAHLGVPATDSEEISPGA